MFPVFAQQDTPLRRNVRREYPKHIPKSQLVLAESAVWRNPHTSKLRKRANELYERHLRESGLLDRLGELNHITSVVCEVMHPRISVNGKRTTRCGAEVLCEHLNAFRSYNHPTPVQKPVFYHLPHDVFYHLLAPNAPLEAFYALSMVNKATRRIVLGSDRLIDWVLRSLELYAEKTYKREVASGVVIEERDKWVAHYAYYFLYNYWNRYPEPIQRARLILLHELVPRYNTILESTPNILLHSYVVLIEMFGARSVLLRGTTWMTLGLRYSTCCLQELLRNQAIVDLFARHGHAYQTEQGEWRFCYYVDGRRVDLTYVAKIHPSTYSEIASLPAEVF